MDVRSPIDIGTDFVGYRIEELIGRGGMGVVYRAYDLRLKRAVALKFVAPELVRDARFRERFARETEVLMSLEHPNVVPIYDAGEVDGRLYLAMRLVPGTDLRRLLRTEGRIDPTRTLRICRHVADALDAAHDRGLVHRDVKPSNVLLDEREHVYLADFGLTRRLDERGARKGEGLSLGTPAYLAPEQIEGGAVDGRADLYSLACVLFECLTGQVPFPQVSRLAAAWAHLDEEPPKASRRRADVPEAIDPVLARALAKDPAARFTSCGGLIDAAEQALGLRPVPLRRRRRAVRAAATVLVLAALALLLAALLVHRGRAGKRAAPPLFARVNTAARIDPATSSLTDVIPVGLAPEAIAAGGRSVWVYNRDGGTVSEIDADDRRVRQTAVLAARAIDLSLYAGPVLAADEGGAWFVGGNRAGEPPFALTRVFAGGGTRRYRLDQEPRGVATGLGAVWVVVRNERRSELLRIDRSSGRVTGRVRFPGFVDSIDVGDGAVWMVGSSAGVLYRVDPRSLRRTGQLEVGSGAARPDASPGMITVASAVGGGQTTFIDPAGLSVVFRDTNCCEPDWGENTFLGDSLWWYDSPTGNVYRQQGAGTLPHEIKVVRATPLAGGPCLTSIALGRGAVWVTVAPPTGLVCKR